MSTEETNPYDAEADPTIGPEDFDPKDFKDPVFPAGRWLDAEITRCARGRNGPDDKYNPNRKFCRVEYRITIDNPELDGKYFRPYPMVTEQGGNFAFEKWCRGVGIDTDRPFTFDANEWLDRKVQIRLNQKMKGSPPRMQNGLEEIRLAEG